MRIVVEGTPIAKKRPRFVRRGKFVGTYNPQETEEGRFLLMAKSQIPGPLEGPLKVRCLFYMPRPKAHYRSGKVVKQLKPFVPFWHTSKPDIDNCLKFIADCLNGVAWKDDAQIVSISSAKMYAENPRTEIEVEVAE